MGRRLDRQHPSPLTLTGRGSAAKRRRSQQHPPKVPLDAQANPGRLTAFGPTHPQPTPSRAWHPWHSKTLAD